LDHRTQLFKGSKSLKFNINWWAQKDGGDSPPQHLPNHQQYETCSSIVSGKGQLFAIELYQLSEIELELSCH